MKYFGTDGIRNKADAFTPEFLNSIAIGLTDYAGSDIKVLLGGDTRESSEWIIADLEIALESLGVEYSSVGVLPTPAINFCFYQMGFDFAIDVTASHNPYTDNGIKIFERGLTSGVKLCEKGCEAIEAAIVAKKTLTPVSPSLRENLHAEAVALYREHLLSVARADLSGLRLGMDCANGATSVINSSVFEELGASVEVINADEHYGQGINSKCGSTHLEQLSDLVVSHRLDFGVAFDGDGDRCLFVDSAGGLVDGDETIALLATFLNLDSAAVTVMANQGLLNWAKDRGVRLEITAVGDSNVAAAMKAECLAIGGEQSGHIILPGEPTGDGLLTALMVAKAVAESDRRSLRALADVMTKFPQVTENVAASPAEKAALKTSAAAKQLLLDFNEKLTAVEGRLLVRPSGTENLIRITMWGDDLTKLQELIADLKEKLPESLKS